MVALDLELEAGCLEAHPQGEGGEVGVVVERARALSADDHFVFARLRALSRQLNKIVEGKGGCPA